MSRFLRQLWQELTLYKLGMDPLLCYEVLVFLHHKLSKEGSGLSMCTILSDMLLGLAISLFCGSRNTAVA